ncbi:IQ domain-containing protein IQM6 [Mercurialis annua]|uniref:IQ domain-containing protein IQM6 n=1 Tax=Mercurialis annua TaxID=3986 RepID=UPI00215E93DD|nr:IQ domain-containing protein IQM6 [Mercurialis annua]XP_050227463.1 IQ domain-containing protein IQM6 [Mercurialis annua]XP_050227464.1 IQ domain-containing protein IQM6 [Mercurialis annua]
MGITFSCPFGDFYDLDAVLMKSIDFDGEDVKTTLRSVSFNGRDSEHTIMRSFGSGKMLFEGSVSFKGRELNTTFSFKSCSDSEMVEISPKCQDYSNKIDKLTRCLSFKGKDLNTILSFKSTDSEMVVISPKVERSLSLAESGDELHHQAAVKLQKVYKSFRTRRLLADCAVVVEQRWWKLLDFAELKRSSISFFDIDKPETAVSRWSRARTKAAKVGKGLSKDAKARKLALQHWLEAIDPRHRYGHNLQFYYCKWLHCQSTQPFFYWLDIGEGKEVNLDICPKSKLQQQCIKYLGPAERKTYIVLFKDGKFYYEQSGQVLDTTGGPKDAKWIFVLSTSKILYVGLKKKGTFQHSSFLAGGATLSAGRLVVENGILKTVWPHSGHYLPTEENFQEFMSFLREQNVDLTNVKESPTDEEEETISKSSSISSFRIDQPDAESCQHTEEKTSIKSLPCETEIREQDFNPAEKTDHLRPKLLSHSLQLNITKLEIPTRDVHEIFVEEVPKQSSNVKPHIEDGYESGEDSCLTEEDFMFLKINLFDEDEEEEDEEPVPKEKILKRIYSHKGMKSYQLAKQLSSKWTTGAGPRIGCMRDYPSELQFRVLEQANLSPKKGSAHSTPRSATRSILKDLTPPPVRRSPLARAVELLEAATPKASSNARNFVN